MIKKVYESYINSNIVWSDKLITVEQIDYTVGLYKLYEMTLNVP